MMTLERLASYKIGERLGPGFLYRGQSPAGETVAIQVLPAWKRNQETMARFQREVTVESAVEHENVARFVGSGSATVNDPELVGEAGEGEVLYLVRELVEGQPLSRLLASRRPPLALAISIAIQAARGLGALHDKGVVHRNLNPDTAVLCPNGTLKLNDFGLVKILLDEAEADSAFKTAAGQTVGTAGYMAPEQFEGGKVDARTDLFSLGVLLYEMVCGRKPFPTEDLLQYFHALANEQPTPPTELVEDVPAQLDEVLRRLLQKRPEDRYLSAAAAERALIACLENPDI